MSDDVVSLRSDMQAWADSMLKLFDRKVRELDIHQGALLQSFANHVIYHAGGDWNKIQFVFEYYGRFVDWGVGRGVTIKNRDAMAAAGLTKRRRKPWFSDVFYKQLPALRRIIEDRLGNTLPLMIARNIDDNADLGWAPTKV